MLYADVSEHSVCSIFIGGWYDEWLEKVWLENSLNHKYISTSSTAGIQLHVSALYVGHLQVVI